MKTPTVEKFCQPGDHESRQNVDMASSNMRCWKAAIRVRVLMRMCLVQWQIDKALRASSVEIQLSKNRLKS